MIQTVETFGIVPPAGSVPNLVQDSFFQRLNSQDKYVALRQQSNIPYYPIQTEEEMDLYNNSVSNYSKDFDRMAQDWNTGTLKLNNTKLTYVLDGLKVYKKTVRLLL
jgi:ferric-dicitrate binding protein FerR (iron transport regulator)